MRNSDEWLKRINGKRFFGRTERKYKCSDGNHEIEYEGHYMLGEEVVPKRIYCEFTTYYPMFGYEKIYETGGLEKTKNLELMEDSLDNFSVIPTVVWSQFSFDSEHLPSSLDEKDLQIFHEKVRKEIEEIMLSIIGDGYCISHEEVLKLDERDRNPPEDDDWMFLGKSDI